MPVFNNMQLMVENDRRGMPIRYPDFAKRVQLAMKDAGVSVNDIKTRLKISYEMARRYTLGQALPRSEKMNMLAEILRTDPAKLQYGGDDAAEKKFQKKQIEWPFAVSYDLYAALPESEKKQVGDYVEFVVSRWHASPKNKRKNA